MVVDCSVTLALVQGCPSVSPALRAGCAPDHPLCAPPCASRRCLGLLSGEFPELLWYSWCALSHSGNETRIGKNNVIFLELG